MASRLTAAIRCCAAFNLSPHFSFQRQINHPLAKFFVTQSRRRRRFGQQAGFRHARQRVHFEHNRLAIRAHHHIHARIIASANGVKRAKRGSLEFVSSSPRQNPPGKNIPCTGRVFIFVIVSCRLSAALRPSATPCRPKCPPSFRARRFFPRPSTSESNFNASRQRTFPVFDALDKLQTRRSNPAAPVSPPAAAANPSATAFSANSTTRNFAVGTPASMHLCFVKTLSNAMRLASASQPV